ncbi:hypothetical protein [Oceanobacillus sp. CAU 1775]
MNMYNDTNKMYEQCKQHMHAYVQADLNDGTSVDGIITGLDDEHVYLAVPNVDAGYESHQMGDDSRQFGYGYGYPGYGYGGYGYGRPRPFRRLILPLAALTAISLLPWY